MSDFLPVSSHDRLQAPRESAPARSASDRRDQPLTAENTTTFKDSFAEASRPDSPPAPEPGPRPTRKQDAPTGTRPEPEEAAAEDIAARAPEPAAQELPAPVDPTTRKTDASTTPGGSADQLPPAPESDQDEAPAIPDNRLVAEKAGGHTKAGAVSRHVDRADANAAPNAESTPIAAEHSPPTPPAGEPAPDDAPTPAPTPTPAQQPVEPQIAVARPAVANALQPGAHSGSNESDQDSTRQNKSGTTLPKQGEATSRPESQSPQPSQASAPPASSNGAAPAPPPASSVPTSNGASFLDLQPQASARGGGAPASAPAPGSAPMMTSHSGATTESFDSQMVRGSLAMTRTTGGAMTMRLEPESLGSLRIQIHVTQGRVAVQFHAETAQARGLLTQHVETLRHAMESQGLKLESVQIHTLARAGSSGSTGHEQTQHQSQSQSGSGDSRQDAAGQQSRGQGDTAQREAQYRQAARQFMNQHNEAQNPATSWRAQWDAATSASTKPAPPVISRT